MKIIDYGIKIELITFDNEYRQVTLYSWPRDKDKLKLRLANMYNTNKLLKAAENSLYKFSANYSCLYHGKIVIYAAYLNVDNYSFSQLSEIIEKNCKTYENIRLR